MSEWKIKGVVEDTEQKSSQQEEQAVLDQAVEKGTITPESAGQEEEIPKINLNEPVPEAEPQQESAVEEVIEEKPTVETDEFVSDSPLELITEEIESEELEAVTETVQEEQLPQVTLPENVDKLVKFMEETGGLLKTTLTLIKMLIP